MPELVKGFIALVPVDMPEELMVGCVGLFGGPSPELLSILKLEKPKFPAVAAVPIIGVDVDFFF